MLSTYCYRLPNPEIFHIFPPAAPAVAISTTENVWRGLMRQAGLTISKVGKSGAGECSTGSTQYSGLNAECRMRNADSAFDLPALIPPSQISKFEI